MTSPAAYRNADRSAYDRTKITPGILHIGVGGFHRAHEAAYIDDLLQLGGSEAWGIIGIGLLPHDAKMRDALLAQHHCYTLVERGEGLTRARVIGSLIEYLLASDAPERVLARMCSPAIKIVSLTITEGGYCILPSTGEFNATEPGIAHDLEHPTTPKTAFGYIVEALRRRRAEGAPPFTILSCDNLQGNGDVARKAALAYAQLLDSDLCEWIAQNVSFPNSMVDRITPATSEADREALHAKFGIEDLWPVVCEPFRQWIIEDKFCNGRPDLERVGVQLVEDVHPYETMKIRLLNASHSAMGYLGYLAGFQTICDTIQDPEFRLYITKLMNEETTPLLPPIPGIDLEQYKKTLIERFSNPAIQDRLTRICLDGSNKLPKFILPSLREGLLKGTPTRRLSLCIASWIRFLTGVDELGNEIVIDDPRAAALTKLAREGGKDPRKILQWQEVFGDLASSEKFVSEVESALVSLYERGARSTITLYL